jgi:hypothetical protein
VTAPRRPDDPLRAPLPAPEARERVVERLTRLFADDRITADDLEDRLERVYHATSGAELDAILSDLPAPSEATAVVPAETAAPRVAALMAAVERQWTGVVPRHLEVRGRLGYVELDLTGATFEPGVTVIDVRAFMGYVQLRLPAGVRVECLGRAFAGFFSLERRRPRGRDGRSARGPDRRARVLRFRRVLRRSGGQVPAGIPTLIPPARPVATPQVTVSQ